MWRTSCTVEHTRLLEKNKHCMTPCVKPKYNIETDGKIESQDLEKGTGYARASRGMVIRVGRHTVLK